MDGWLVVSTPLKNHGVRQLGWWHSQYLGSHNIHVPNHQPDGEAIVELIEIAILMAKFTSSHHGRRDDEAPQSVLAAGMALIDAWDGLDGPMGSLSIWLVAILKHEFVNGKDYPIYYRTYIEHNPNVPNHQPGIYCSTWKLLFNLNGYHWCSKIGEWDYLIDSIRTWKNR